MQILALSDLISVMNHVWFLYENNFIYVFVTKQETLSAGDKKVCWFILWNFFFVCLLVGWLVGYLGGFIPDKKMFVDQFCHNFVSSQTYFYSVVVFCSVENRRCKSFRTIECQVTPFTSRPWDFNSGKILVVVSVEGQIIVWSSLACALNYTYDGWQFKR